MLPRVRLIMARFCWYWCVPACDEAVMADAEEGEVGSVGGHGYSLCAS